MAGLTQRTLLFLIGLLGFSCRDPLPSPQKVWEILLVEEAPKGADLAGLKAALSRCGDPSNKFDCHISINTVHFDEAKAPSDALEERLRHQRLPDAVVGVSAELALRTIVVSPSVPVIFDGFHDPRRSCLVDTLSRPRNKATGMFSVPEVGDRMLGLLKTAYPKVQVAVVLVDQQKLGQKSCTDGAPSNLIAPDGCKDGWVSSRRELLELIAPESLERAATYYGVQIRFLKWCANSAGGWRKLLSGVMKAGLIVPLREQAYHERKRLVRSINELKIPAIYQGSTFALNGGLMSLRTRKPDSSSVSVNLLRQLMRGRSASELPVESPMQTEVVFNRLAARDFGLVPTVKFLKVVDEFIEASVDL